MSSEGLDDLSTDIVRAFLEQSRGLLLTDYMPKIERCLEGLSDADVWWRPNEASNAIGNLILHLCGNVRQWIIAGVGQGDFERDRQQEFDERSGVPSTELMARLRQTVREADHVMGGVTPETLLARRHIQNYDVTVLEAIYHVVEHFGMHTGQIIMLSKMRRSEDLKLWRP
jgi:uncharacterized damage-inducible protein DinB